MTKTITATEAVRKFSEILNSIKYTGNDYTIMRGGKPVATIRPAETHAKALTLGDLAGLVKSLPALGDEGVTIGAHDLMIASTAIALGFSVVTADGDYSKLKEASVEKFVV